MSNVFDIMLGMPGKSKSKLRGKIRTIPNNLMFIYNKPFHFFPVRG